jgi:hypothetical protein
MNETINEKLFSIIKAYDALVKGIDKEARSSSDRAYGGIVRAGKGKMVESIGRELIKIAWQELKSSNEGLSFLNKIIKVPMRPDYLSRIKDPEVKNFIEKNLKSMFYGLKPDIGVVVNGKFKISVECKAYTENAMLKRILVDCTLLKHVYPDSHFVLLQLESQLGGDYSQLISGKYGSPATHTLLSYFDVDLHIITLLEGERKVDQPIHQTGYYKPLKIERLREAVEIFKELLEK